MQRRSTRQPDASLLCGTTLNQPFCHSLGLVSSGSDRERDEICDNDEHQGEHKSPKEGLLGVFDFACAMEMQSNPENSSRGC